MNAPGLALGAARQSLRGVLRASLRGATLRRVAVAASDAQYQELFWRQYLRFGWLVVFAESGIVTAYAALTPGDGGVRSDLVAFGLAFAIIGIVGSLSSTRCAQQWWRERLVLVNSTTIGLATSGIAVVDGGVDSPLLILAFLPVAYVAAALPTRMVVVVAAASLADLIAVCFADPGITHELKYVVAVAAFAVGLASLAVGTTHQREHLQTRLAALAAELRRGAETDSLTGCANFGAFQQFLTTAVDQAASGARPLSVLLCDLDDLRSFNSAHGESAGDEALIWTARRLADLVGDEDALVARIGGDDLVVVLPDKSAEQALALATEVVADRARAGRRPGLSIGVAQLDPRMPTPLRLMRDAERAAAAAKEDGGDRAAVHRPGDLRSHADDAADERQSRTDRTVRHAVRQLDEMRSIMLTLINDAPAGLMFLDRERRILVANVAACDAFGIGETAVGQRIVDLPGFDPAVVSAAVDRVLDTDAPVAGVEIDAGAGDGAGRNWLASFYPVHLDDDPLGVGIVTVDITDRKQNERAREHLTGAVVAAVAATAEARDPYTAGHQARVGRIAGKIAAALGVSAHDTEGIRLSAAIHDIGKVAVPAELLSRPGRLRPEERQLIQVHPDAGAEILRDIEFPWPVADMVRQHHERFDGSGYPRGLSGAEIVLGARIIAVADVLEAMASHRPYRAALGADAAIAELIKGRETLYDPAVVDACLQLHADGSFDEDFTEWA